MGAWSKRALPTAELHGLGLTPEQGFVLSRLDTPLSSTEIVALTGIDHDRVREILAVLASKGAVEVPADEASSSPVSGASAVTAAPPSSQGALPKDDAEEEEEEPEEPEAKIDEANYRKIYETRLHGLSTDQRVEMATTAHDPELLALCFDPEPAVIRAVMTNPQRGLTHARLAARYHRTSLGLDAVGQSAEIVKDRHVQRNLLRNTHLSEALVKRILNPKRMMDAYKASMDTDTPERTRQFARGVLRNKFAVAQGEERAGLVASTEGRVLAALTGLTFDARATQILCARSYNSVIFIQNLARFAACPPPLLAHLVKQPLVRRQQHLKNMLLQHPNMPGDAKRNS